MAIKYGDDNLDARKMTITLRTEGLRAVSAGWGPVVLFGAASRGPSDVKFLASPSEARSVYYSGELKEGIALAFGQGASVVLALRIMGAGNAKAGVTVSDGVNDVMNITAKGPGAYGNSIYVQYTAGLIDHKLVDLFNGDGGAEYALSQGNIIENSHNKVTVNGSEKTIIYTGPLSAGEVLIDKTLGTLTFYTGEYPTDADQVEVGLRYQTVTMFITDLHTTERYRDCRDLVELQACAMKGKLIDIELIPGETHLPAVGRYPLTGGDDGDEVDTDDWEEAFNLMGTTIRRTLTNPTAAAICGIPEIDQSVPYNLIPKIENWANEMADVFFPLLCFVGARPNETFDNLVDLGGLFNNPELVIVANPWDTSDPRQNMAVARAAKESALPIGESAAYETAAISGVLDLLNQWNDPETVALTRRGLDVLEKHTRGILPHKGITTSTEDPLMRTVDMRTINWIMIATWNILSKFFFARNTKRIRTYMRDSMMSFLAGECRKENIYPGYLVTVSPDEIDPNKVIVWMRYIPVGHIEVIEVTMDVGVYGNLREIQGEV